MTASLAVGERVGPRGGSRPRVGVVVLTALAVVPVVLALWTAARTSRAHVLLDYWHVLAKVTADDGSLRWGQVLTYHLDQPFVVPSLLFWADAAWLGGDNRVLTVLAVLLLAVVVVVLRAMLPGTFSPLVKAALTAGFAFLVCSSHLAELWLQATNGISWVPAVTCAVVAVWCAHRGRVWWSWGAAVVACLCFGAGLPVWFAVALTSAARGERRWRWLTPVVAGVVVVVVWWVTKPAGPQSLATTAVDPDRRLSVFAAALGGLWSADVPVVALVLLVSRVGRDAAVAGWVGLAGYAVLVAGLLALGRTTTAVGNVGLLGRYGLAAALATSALLVLVVYVRPGLSSRVVVTGVVTLGLVTHAIGGGKQDQARAAYAPLEVAAVALRVEAPQAMAALSIEPSVVPAARALGAFPFNDHFTLGCAPYELGSRVDLSRVTALPGPADAGPSKGVIDSPAVTGDAVLSGWAVVGGQAPECVLVVDGTGAVVGGGVSHLSRADTPQPGWRAVAAPGAADLTVLAVQSGGLYRLSRSGG